MEDLFKSIADKIIGYRKDDLPAPTPEHVERWSKQFSPEHQEIVLTETDHILDEIYLTEQNVDDFLKGLSTNKKLVGNDPAKFWKSAFIFKEQEHGNSLNEMTGKLFSILESELGISETGDEDSDTFIYVDDFIFTGSRLFNDLISWIKDAPERQISVHIIVIGYHMYGQWSTENRLKKLAKEEGKKISFTFWSIEEARLENRLRYKDNSDILWPTKEILSVPEIAEYIKIQDPDDNKIKYRNQDNSGKSKLFTFKNNIQVLEREFTLAGLKIRSFSATPSEALKPLGFSPFAGFGFGAVVTTYRNCPNNCPLALWWGSPNASQSHPFSKWYPLLERKTYEHSSEPSAFSIDDLKSLFK